jgi:hypothetical protein
MSRSSTYCTPQWQWLHNDLVRTVPVLKKPFPARNSKQALPVHSTSHLTPPSPTVPLSLSRSLPKKKKRTKRGAADFDPVPQASQGRPVASLPSPAARPTAAATARRLDPCDRVAATPDPSSSWCPLCFSSRLAFGCRHFARLVLPKLSRLVRRRLGGLWAGIGFIRFGLHLPFQDLAAFASPRFSYICPDWVFL